MWFAVAGLLPLAAALGGCASQQVNIAPVNVPGGYAAAYVQALEFTDEGLPRFAGPLDSKPRSTGTHYYQVLYEYEKPTAAFLVGVVGENKADWSRPFTTIYRWTGKGFNVGWRFAGQVYDTNCGSSGCSDFEKGLGSAAAGASIGIVVGLLAGTGGFVIGATASAPQFAQALQRSVDPTRERLLMVMRLSYDASGRMKAYTFELPGGRVGQQIVTTRCAYDDGMTKPRDCVVESSPERVTRKTGYGL